MTIKQQGGIFGRNPTFNDLTVEGTFTTSGAQTMEELNVDNVNINGNTISSTDSNGNINLTPEGNGNTVAKRLKGTDYFEFRKDTVGGSTLAYLVNDAATGTTAESVGIAFAPANNLDAVAQILAKRAGTYSSGGTRDSELQFYNCVNSTPTHQWTITNAGNLKAVISGNGIDFSATSGTGTSELFDDYEEGEYTATLTCGTIGTVTLQAAANTLQYTKIGRMCYVTGQIRVDSISSPVGYLQLNLPFTNSNLTGESDRTTGVVLPQNTLAANVSDFVLWIGAGASAATIVLGDATTGQYDTAQEMTASTQIYFNFSYIPA